MFFSSVHTVHIRIYTLWIICFVNKQNINNSSLQGQEVQIVYNYITICDTVLLRGGMKTLELGKGGKVTSKVLGGEQQLCKKIRQKIQTFLHYSDSRKTNFAHKKCLTFDLNQITTNIGQIEISLENTLLVNDVRKKKFF